MYLYYEEINMTSLEIIMLVIGLICFVASFILTKDEAEPTAGKNNYKPELTKEQKDYITEQVNQIVTNQMVMLEESTEAALDKISNTKIMEMNEYVESVFNEINKNHNETVFMYDMLNEKSKEVKNVVKDINAIKSQVDTSKETIDSDAQHLESLIKDAQKAVREMDIAIKAAYKTKDGVLVQQEEEKQKVLDNVIKPQFFEQKEESLDEHENNYMAKAEPEAVMNPNYNEQILAMHAEGKSSLEIAKTLNLGIGEVKLVLDLFNKSK